MTRTAPPVPESGRRWFQTAFEDMEKRLNGGAISAVHRLRRAALAHVESAGFPTTREEEWRFTNIAPIARTEFRMSFEPPDRSVTPDELSRWRFGTLHAHQLVFVNGQFSPALSSIRALPAGVRAGSLAEALRRDPALVEKHLARLVKPEENAFTALNTAFLQDGAFLFVPDGVAIPDPVHLIFFAADGTGPFAAHPRNLFLIGRDSRVSIVETYASRGGGTYLTNAVSEIVIGENAVMEHDKLQSESLSAYHVGSTHIRMGRNSALASNSIALGGAIVRNNVSVVLGAEGIECTLNGLSLSTGQQLIDNHTTIDHASPHCASHELYKAILDGASHGVFNGKIYVRKDAQKTDAKQTNKSLLLSAGATIDTKPQLEIFADDVKCTHGATVGQLDEEQVFYLRSRGIGATEARDLLTFAFAGDIIGRVHVVPLRAELDAMIRARLHEGRITTE